MLFYKMSRDEHNIRKNRFFYAYFNLQRIMSRFLKIKKFNLSENTPQNLAATNCTSDVQECTRVHYFVRIRDFINRRIQ